MAVNYRNNAGVDFDDLYDPFVQGTPPAATGYRNLSGVDLAGRYAPIAFGTKGPNVNYRNLAGVDLSNLWAAIGTARYLPVIPFGAYDQSIFNNHDAGATFTCAFNNDGTWAITQSNVPGGGSSSGSPLSGVWASTTGAGVGSGYNIRITSTMAVTANTAGGTPSFTGSTGFVALDSGFTITVTTSHLINGGGGGVTTLSGGYTIEIQSKSGGPITTSTLRVNNVTAQMS